MIGPEFDSARAQQVRLRHPYRTLFLRGRLALAQVAPLPLVGPDCAYHLCRSKPAT